MNIGAGLDLTMISRRNSSELVSAFPRNDDNKKDKCDGINSVKK